MSIDGKKLICFAFAIGILFGDAAFGQTAGGGRADPEPTRADTRVRRSTKPVVRRTPPKRVVPAARTAESYQAEGDKFYESGDHDSALAAYEAAVKIKPLLKSLYRIGWIYNEFEEYQKALLALDRAAAIGPNESAIFLEIGYAQRRLKQNDKAAAALKRSLALNPNSAIANYELGALYNDLGQYREAIPLLNASIANRTDHSDTYEELGFAQRKLGMNNEAIASYRRAIQLDPQNTGALMGLGDAYFYGTKQNREAIAAYLEGLKLSPANYIAAHNVAYAYNETGNYNEAIRWAAEALKHKRDYYQAHAETGYAYLKLGQGDNAIAAYRRALQIKPDHAASHFGIGDVYFEALKDYPMALANYTRGLQYSPDNQAALYRSGWCYNNQQRYQEAITTLTKLLEINSQPAHYHREIAYSYWKSGRTAEAMTTLNRAIQLNRDEAVSYYYLGLIYVEQRNRDAATRMHRELVRLNSPNAQALLEQINRLR